MTSKTRPRKKKKTALRPLGPWISLVVVFILLATGTFFQVCKVNPPITAPPSFPTVVPTPTPGTPRMDLRVLLGQRLLICVDYPRLSPEQKRLLKHGWVGGVVLYEQDVKSKPQLTALIRKLQALSPRPLLVAVDQEGGGVRRLKPEQGFDFIPSESVIGKKGDPALAHEFGVRLGKQLHEVGINLDFAPVVDLTGQTPTSIISDHQRAIGSDPDQVAELADQIVRGMREQGVLAAAKHFPGETLSQGNPHQETAVSSVPLTEIRARDLVPYRRLIQDGLPAVMLSHVTYQDIDPLLPASLSSKVVQGLLRKEMGFRGLVICDDLQMEAVRGKFPLEEAAVKAVEAGVDLLIATGDTGQKLLDALVKAAKAKRISLDEARESFERIQKTKKERGLRR